MPSGLNKYSTHTGLSHAMTHIQIYQLPLWGCERSASVSWLVGSPFFFFFKENKRIRSQQEEVLIGLKAKYKRKICHLAGQLVGLK